MGFCWGTWGVPKIRGELFGGPYTKDNSILGSILGSPNFGKLPYSGSIEKGHILLLREEYDLTWFNHRKSTLLLFVEMMGGETLGLQSLPRGHKVASTALHS